MKKFQLLIGVVTLFFFITFAQAQNPVLLNAKLSQFPNTWSVTECCGWTGIWQRRPNTNYFDAQWKHTNGTTASDVLELKSWNNNEVVFFRQSLNGQYKAIYNPATKTMTSGTATWYPAGAGWSAVNVADVNDEKGKVILPHR